MKQRHKNYQEKVWGQNKNQTLYMAFKLGVPACKGGMTLKLINVLHCKGWRTKNSCRLSWRVSRAKNNVENESPLRESRQ